MPDGASVITEVTGTIESQLDKALWLESFTAVERLSEPFRISCEVSSEVRLDLGGKLGTRVSLNVSGSQMDTKMSRAFHGLLMEASEIEVLDNTSRYHLVLRPWFTKLQLLRGSRIFQHKSAKDIISHVLGVDKIGTGDWEWKCTTRGTLVREYCVQYNESDFDFLSRLMEEEGIYYFFRHTADNHVMVMCDGPGCHAPFAPGPVPLNDENAAGPHFSLLTEHVKPTITTAYSRDNHFQNFGETYNAQSKRTGLSEVLEGASYTYPGTHSYLTDDGTTTGDAYAKLRLEAAQAEELRYLAEGDAFAVSVGCILDIVPVVGDHLNPQSPVKILVTGAVHAFSGQQGRATRGMGGLVTRISVEGVPSDHVWRPMLRTPKPIARGPQVATVAGPSSDPIHVDKWGRVLVLFQWDLWGKLDGTRQDESDGSSSCWLRVATSWAGQQFGELFLPRVGTEVIVDFFDGDMDRPFVSAQAYNNKKVQAERLYDYVIPAGSAGAGNTINQKTVSGWVTQTVYGGVGDDYPNAVDPPKSSAGGYNQISFEDKSGHENVVIRAQRDMGVRVYRDETRIIGRTRKEKVGYNLDLEVQTGDETRTVTKGKRTTTIQQDETLTVKMGNLNTTVEGDDKNETHTVKGGKRTTSIKKNDELEVTEGDRIVQIDKGKHQTLIMEGDMLANVYKGDYSLNTVQGDIQQTAMKSIKLTAEISVELTVGANSIKIDQTGVTINGVMFQVTGKTMGTVDGGGMLTVKGGVVMIN